MTDTGFIETHLPFFAIAVLYGYVSVVLDQRVLTPARATRPDGTRGGVFNALREAQPVLYLGASWLIAIPFPDPLNRGWSLLFTLSYYTLAAGLGLIAWSLAQAIARRRYDATLNLPGDTLRPKRDGS